MSSEILNKFLKENLEDLKEKGLYNVIDPVEGPNGPVITIAGRELINLSSNNYLGLATDRRLIEACIEERKHMVSELVPFVRSTEHWIFMSN